MVESLDNCWEVDDDGLVVGVGVCGSRPHPVSISAPTTIAVSVLMLDILL
ncbi:MAG: hypothetical protein ACXWD3_11160 [Mycobacterium sp.]